MMDYGTYCLTSTERRRYYAFSAAVSCLLGLLFYRSLLPALLCIPLARSGEKHWALHKAGLRRERLLTGFKDALYSISTAISAGRQLPDAVRDAAKFVADTHGADSDIARELGRIAHHYTASRSELESLLGDFGNRSGLEEIRQFARICSVCRQTGADLEHVALQAAGLILQRIHFRREVQMLTAQKKLDTGLLVLLPLFVLLFLNGCAPEYLAVMYSTAIGRVLMSGCLALIFAALYISVRMIEVTL